MADNPLYHGGMTLVDITQDTVTADTLAEGITAHDKDGNALVGVMTINSGSTINGVKRNYVVVSDEGISSGDFVTTFYDESVIGLKTGVSTGIYSRVDYAILDDRRVFTLGLDNNNGRLLVYGRICYVDDDQLLISNERGDIVNVSGICVRPCAISMNDSQVIVLGSSEQKDLRCTLCSVEDVRFSLEIQEVLLDGLEYGYTRLYGERIDDNRALVCAIDSNMNVYAMVVSVGVDGALSVGSVTSCVIPNTSDQFELVKIDSTKYMIFMVNDGYIDSVYLNVDATSVTVTNTAVRFIGNGNIQRIGVSRIKDMVYISYTDGINLFLSALGDFNESSYTIITAFSTELLNYEPFDVFVIDDNHIGILYNLSTSSAYMWRNAVYLCVIEISDWSFKVLIKDLKIVEANGSGWLFHGIILGKRDLFIEYSTGSFGFSAMRGFVIKDIIKVAKCRNTINGIANADGHNGDVIEVWQLE